MRFVSLTPMCPPQPKRKHSVLGHGIRLARSFEALLADSTVDALVLATPNSQHESQVKEAAAAGKHVYVEKPFALTSTGAREALAAVERAGVTLGVGLSRRFHPSMAELQRRVAAGELGVVGSMVAELTAMTGFHRPAGSWRRQPRGRTCWSDGIDRCAPR